MLPEFFPPTKNGEKVCDIAGGVGIVASWMATQGYEVSLVEFSDKAVAEAKRRGVQRIFPLEIKGIHSLPFEDNYFDSIFFGDIIEHLFDAESVLLEMKRILKPGGKIVVSCPNIAYWRFRMLYVLDGSLERVDVAQQKPWEQEHIRFYNIKILQEFFKKLGFEFVKFKGVNDIWHSKLLANYFPHLFAHTIVAEFKNSK